MFPWSRAAEEMNEDSRQSFCSRLLAGPHRCGPWTRLGHICLIFSQAMITLTRSCIGDERTACLFYP